MPYIDAPGRQLYAETFGNPDDPALVLVNGLTSQLLSWPVDWCEAFVDRGFFVVRYDNRDCGLSTIFKDGDSYSLSDLADDCAQVIEHFNLAPANILGISMGGMIVQALAVERPELVSSMTSIASTTGNPTVGMPTDEAKAALLAPPAATREEVIANNLIGKRIWGSPEGWNEEEFIEFCGDAWDRSHPDGNGLRQYQAILEAGNRDELVKTISVPSLVIHGDVDTLIDASGGRHTAELIDGCEYLEIEGMGHDIPQVEWPQMVAAVTALAARAYEGRQS